MAVKPGSDDQYSEQETVARREAALKRMLRTPPKPHDEMKLGKGKAKPSKKLADESKTRLARKGRVHKGKSRA